MAAADPDLREARDVMTEFSPFQSWADMWRSWPTAALAPKELWQSINRNWSFGNFIINGQNSSDPETEQAILARESYGRQIGKLLDAVNELAKARPDRETNTAYVEVADLKARVDRLKREGALDRIDQLRRDLELLRASREPEDQAIYRENMTALRALLQDSETKA
jgi:hypothetical protein